MQAKTEASLKTNSLEKAKHRLMDGIGMQTHANQDVKGDGVSKDNQNFGHADKKLSWIVTALRAAKVKHLVFFCASLE